MDNGPLETTPEQRQEDALENESNRFKRVCRRWGLRHWPTANYHPRANPTERRNQEMKKILRVAHQMFPDQPWDRHLEKGLFNIRRRRNAATGQSLIGSELNRPIGIKYTVKDHSVADCKLLLKNSNTEMSREIDRDESPASGDGMSGWKGPARGPKIPKITDNRNFPKLVVKNSYQPLANVEEKMDTASPASTSTTTPPKEKTPPPITIHGALHVRAPGTSTKRRTEMRKLRRGPPCEQHELPRLQRQDNLSSDSERAPLSVIRDDNRNAITDAERAEFLSCHYSKIHDHRDLVDVQSSVHVEHGLYVQLMVIVAFGVVEPRNCDICNASSTMAPTTQPPLEDVLNRMSAQIAQEVHELRCFSEARLVQLEESNEDMVSMSAIPQVVIVQPQALAEATQPPADHDMEGPFQQVKGKKPRKRRPSVASLEDQAAPQINPNRPAPAKQVAQNKPPAENKIPPIIIHDAAKWASFSSAMMTCQIKFSKAKICIDGIRVKTVSVDNFRALTHLLEERKVPYHSFVLSEQKTLRAVLRTVPCEIDIDDVRADLEEQGLAPIKVTRMTSSRSKKPLPLVLVEVPKGNGAIFDLKAVCHLSVTVEQPHKKGTPSQCHHCQRFHHSQRHCHALLKCVKCGDTLLCKKQMRKLRRGFQTKKSSGPAAPKAQQKPAAAPRNNPPPPAASVRPSAPKTGPATNNNASKSFADAAATKKTALATLLQATPKQSIAFYNARGLRSSRNELEVFADDHDVDTLLVSETKLQPGTPDPKIRGFELYHRASCSPEPGSHRRDNRGRERSIDDHFVLPPPATLAPGKRYQRNFRFRHLGHRRGRFQRQARGLGQSKSEILIEHAYNIDLLIEAPPEPTYYDARDFHADTLDIVLLKNVPIQTRLHASQALDSDHLPVLMHIGDEANDTNRNSTVQNTNWSRFAEILESDFGPVPRIESVEDFESAAGAFEEKIKIAMFDSTRIRVEPPKNENLPQFKVDLIRAKNLASHRAYRTGSAVDRTEAKRLGNEKTQISHRGDNSIWRMTNALRSNKKPLPPIHGTRGLVFSDDEKAEAFADSLELQCRPNIADADLDHIEVIENEIEEILSEPNDTPITPTSPEEVREIIGSLKVNKAPGPDHIPNTALKLLPEKVVVALTAIIDASLRLCHFPSRWKRANRPISLLSNVSKIVEKVILTRLVKMANDNAVIPDEQFGFRTKHSTADQLIHVTEFISHGMNQRKSTGAIFLYVAKAFDTAWHDGLVHKLHTAGLLLAMVKLINSFLQNRVFHAKIGHALSTESETEAGVPQDDTAILTCSGSPELATQRLQSAVESLETWLRLWRIDVNPEKSRTTNKITIYRTIVRPAMMYGVAVWGNVANTQLQKLQNKFLRAAFNAPWFVRNAQLHREANLPTMREYRQDVAGKFFEKRLITQTPSFHARADSSSRGPGNAYSKREHSVDV
ncbi:hypothetical protein GEV33_006785 [Tenebrio molitor]|uniref:Pre-C2HC domain-containing protein n=1 Tax=Tenebrio molitor TaxID=7067 RepID=A0A8J6LJF0_TENMO|nr:hypothetical protein GEV33_006785 [Tenebrio molitor]